jgi:predicted RNA-binding Zn ribbon-like protein
MDFTHYTDECSQVGPDLVNTLGWPSGNEYLPDVESLRSFLDDHGILGDIDLITEEDLTSVRELRARFHAVFHATDEVERGRLLNAILKDVGAMPQLTDHDGHWHVHYVSAPAPLADRLAAIAAMGLVAVISEFGHDRLGLCSADRCEDAFVDTSRNRSKRYCSDTCSTRTNVARHRARKKAASATRA